MWKYSVGILINSWPLPQPILISLLSEEGDFFVLYKLTLLLSTHYQLSIPFHISSILSFLALVSWHKKNKLENKTKLSRHFVSCDFCLVLSFLCNQVSRKNSLPCFTSSLFLLLPCNLVILPELNCKCPHWGYQWTSCQNHWVVFSLSLSSMQHLQLLTLIQ